MDVDHAYPFHDEVGIRTFYIDADDSEYVWHRDHENRLVEIVAGDGWQFQWDKALPWLLKPGIKFKIQAYEYHRLIKGTNDLLVRITSLDK